MGISTSYGASDTARSIIPCLAAVMLYCVVSTANAQYYYVPSRDYYRNDTVEGTVLGGAFGAVTGAIVGGRRDRTEGALIGAGVGALTGNLLGRSKDRADEYQAATGAAAVASANRTAAARAVTNVDLIRLTQAGLSEDVIVSTIRSRGIRLDLSPQGLISLKESGVSDRVLLAAQDLTHRHVAAQRHATTTIVTERVPSTVIVSPYPRNHYVPRYHPRPYPHRHHVGTRVRYRFPF